MLLNAAGEPSAEPMIPKQDLHATLARLAERFPQTFVAEKHLPHRPLKVGIDRDIQARWPGS
jgi:sRNA-binding protein